MPEYMLIYVHVVGPKVQINLRIVVLPNLNLFAVTLPLIYRHEMVIVQWVSVSALPGQGIAHSVTTEDALSYDTCFICLISIRLVVFNVRSSYTLSNK